MLATNATTAIRSAIVLLVASLAGCGGGGGSTGSSASSGSTVSSSTLSGTAAAGTPIAGSVVAIDVNGKMSAAAPTQAQSGAFTVDVTGLTAPFLLTVAGQAGGRQVMLSSLATAVGQTVNLTPLTDLIVSAAAGVPGGPVLVDTCSTAGAVAPSDCIKALQSAASGTRLRDAAQQVAAMIAPLNTGSTDPLNGSFTANGQGMDAVLDRISVTPAGSASASATVTLVATQTVLGQLSPPVAAGQPGTFSISPPSAQQVQTANTAATALPEIQACMSSLAALYTGVPTSPTKAQVEPYVDDAFSMGAAGKADWVDIVIQILRSGVNLQALNLAARDMSPLDAGERAQLASLGIDGVLRARSGGGAPVRFDATGNPVSAWAWVGDTNDGLVMQYRRGAPFAGCPGGWRMAGPQHLDMHMNARINRNEDASGVAALRRERAFHINGAAVSQAMAAAGLPDVDRVTVTGPGLSSYSGNLAQPVGADRAVTLKRSPSAFIAWLTVVDATGYYRNNEALQSCQDIAQAGARAGAPCVDETRVVPGAVYGWALQSASDGSTVFAFPYEIDSVPLSKAFALANASQVFATITGSTPATLADARAAMTAAGPVLDGVFGISYTLGSAYGAVPDNCEILLYDAAWNYLLTAEADASFQRSGCTFVSSGLNSGSLAKPANPGSLAHMEIAVANHVLGNQTVTSRSLR